jgi:hypothetical protein
MKLENNKQRYRNMKHVTSMIFKNQKTKYSALPVPSTGLGALDKP